MDGESDVPQPVSGIKVTDKSAEISSGLKELTELASDDKGLIPPAAEADVTVARLEVIPKELQVSKGFLLFSRLVRTLLRCNVISIVKEIQQMSVYIDNMCWWVYVYV